MKCVVGGTFGILHAGHERLLRAALAFDEIEIGLIKDRYVKENKIYPVIAYEKRKKNLEMFVERLIKMSKIKRKFEIVESDNKYDFALQTDADAIIVSSETEKIADKINTTRRINRRKPLHIISVPIVYGEDYIRISAARIYQKKIDANGKRLKPVVFALGSINPSKENGLKKAAKKLFKKFKIKAMRVQSAISEQPFGQETVRGAKNRAKAAYFATDADFGVGFESGLFKIGDNYHDVAVCAIFDGERITFGNSMGFQMPKSTIELLVEHKDLGAVMEELSGIKNIGYKKGAIHFLSAGLLQRQEMNEQAFLCAMIPRISERNGIFYY